jgi:uncharacterized membrane protein
MKIETIILVLATLSTGMMAGIFFTWSNAVTPGIGKLNDMGYLRSLQSMNRVILNPAFRIVFIGAVVTVALTPAFYYKSYPNNAFWFLLITFVIYWIGAFGTTFLGNIPLNNLLDKANLDTISTENAHKLRTTIEIRWNALNLVRTITSALSFLLLIISLLMLHNK